MAIHSGPEVGKYVGKQKSITYSTIITADQSPFINSYTCSKTGGATFEYCHNSARSAPCLHRRTSGFFFSLFTLGFLPVDRPVAIPSQLCSACAVLLTAPLMGEPAMSLAWFAIIWIPFSSLGVSLCCSWSCNWATALHEPSSLQSKKIYIYIAENVYK